MKNYLQTKVYGWMSFSISSLQPLVPQAEVRTPISKTGNSIFHTYNRNPNNLQVFSITLIHNITKCEVSDQMRPSFFQVLETEIRTTGFIYLCRSSLMQLLFLLLVLIHPFAFSMAPQSVKATCSTNSWNLLYCFHSFT
jgi:hypothetical protein